MKKNILSYLVVLLFAVFSLSGCVYLIVGSVGAVGGYIVSPDTVEGLTEHDEVTVMDAVVEIVSIMGLIVTEHETGGLIQAKIGGAQVTITVVPVNQSIVKMSVKARKNFLPRISVAQDVYVKIMNELSGD